MHKITKSLLLLTGIFVLSGCSLYGSNQNAPKGMPTNMQPTTNQNTNPATTGNIVDIQNFAFNPGTLKVKKGTTVIWTNSDSASHQIKSASFNSSLLSKGQSFSFTFNEVGTFDYSCAIHPSMLGKIIVE